MSTWLVFNDILHNRKQVLNALSNLKKICEYILTMTCNSNEMLSGHMEIVGFVLSSDFQPAFEELVAFPNNFTNLGRSS